MNGLDKPLVQLTDSRVLRRAVEQAGHAIMLVDTDATIEYVNPAFERITGYEADEAIGRTPRLLNSGEHAQSFFADLWETILGGDVWESEIVNRRKDGSLIRVDHTIAPVTDTDGTIEKFVAVFSDVTEQTLEHQQLQVLFRVLRHNLRNELEVLLGYAEIITRNSDDDRITGHARAIGDAAERLSRVGEKAHKIQSTVTDVGEPTSCVDITARVTEQVDTVTERYPTSSIATSVPSSSIAVKAPVSDAVNEVLENALHHNDTESPTVRLTVELHDRSEGNPFGPESWVTIEIADDGPGIPQQEQLVLKAGEETPLQHGSGVGLWIVHWIVRTAGGKIEIEPNHPCGSRVSLHVPVCHENDSVCGLDTRSQEQS